MEEEKKTRNRSKGEFGIYKVLSNGCLEFVKSVSGTPEGKRAVKKLGVEMNYVVLCITAKGSTVLQNNPRVTLKEEALNN